MKKFIVLLAIISNVQLFAESQYVCGVITELSADTIGTNAVSGNWTSSIPEISITSIDSTALHYHVQVFAGNVPNFFINGQRSVWFYWNYITAGSINHTDSMEITFFQLPHADGGIIESVCGYTTQLHADTIGSGIISAYWTCNLPGIIINQSGNVPADVFVDASQVSDFFINGKRSVYFYWHVTNGVGCASEDSALVNFYEVPQANAGPDTSVCGMNYESVATWSIPYSTGIWSSVAGNPGLVYFTPNNAPDASITVTQYGSYHVVWREMNAENSSCFTADTVTINFIQVPMPDAGVDFEICGVFAYICATPSILGGYWSGPSGIPFFDTNIDSIIYYNLNGRYNPCTWIRYTTENDTITMYWTENNGACYGYDSVNIYFGSIQNAIILTNPSDSLVCGASYSLLSASEPNYGYGYWADSIPNTQFTPSAFSNDSLAATTAYYGAHYFHWITVNGPCRDTSNALYVRFINSGTVKGNINGLDNSVNYSTNLFKSNLFNSSTTSLINTDGSYVLNANPGTYYLKVENLNPENSTGIASTYYGDTWLWQDAQTITLQTCDTLSANINMYNYTYASGGNCLVCGTISYDNGGPVKDADVYLLYKPANLPAIHEKTDENGYYSLNHIPQGNYKIQVDISGLPQVTTHYITVNPFDTLFANVNFIVDTTQITKDYGFGIYADTTLYIPSETIFSINSIHVFPNPCSDNVYISCNDIITVDAEWIDVNGKIISSLKINLSKGITQLSVPKNIDSHVCFLKITYNNTVFIKKLIKKS